MTEEPWYCHSWKIYLVFWFLSGSIWIPKTKLTIALDQITSRWLWWKWLEPVLMRWGCCPQVGWSDEVERGVRREVTVFSMLVAEICKQLVGSGSPPILVARAYPHSSESRWVSFADEITNKQPREQDLKNWQGMIQRCNEEYEARISSSDWSEAASSKSKKESQETLVNKATAALKELWLWMMGKPRVQEGRLLWMWSWW